MKTTNNKNKNKPVDFFKDNKVDFGYITANWLLGYLASNNADVLILVDKNDNPILTSHLYMINKTTRVEYKRANIFNPNNIKLFINDENCRPKIVKFWDIAIKNIQIQISGTNSIFSTDAIIDIYRKYYEKYCNNHDR